MRVIDRKLLRDLWQMRLQALAIALVIGAGISIFIMSLSTLSSLYESRERYYQQNHFADVFARIKRAPLSLVDRIQQIPGVDRVEARVVAHVTIEVDDYDAPISGHLLSLPPGSRGQLNQIVLRRGNLLDDANGRELIISEEFANAHQLKVGDQLRVVINGRSRDLSIAGIALSPEYIYQIAPGALFPDRERYGVFWMSRHPLSIAYDLDGAFNDVSLTLIPGTNAQGVIDRLDDLLAPYGGIGAYARSDQLSNRFLSEELRQQKTMATVFPSIFLGVAAFLLNVVISRQIGLERDQIATLKAFGYGNLEIGSHYLKLVLMILAVGVLGGTLAGIYMGQGMSNLYLKFYSFPRMYYILEPWVVALACSVSLAVAALGTWQALSRAVHLSPAQAMRPQAPGIFRITLLERWGAWLRFSQVSRMALRHIGRRPLKSFLTTLGIALACGTMMVAGFQKGAIDFMLALQFDLSQPSDIIASFNEPASQRALYSLQSQPGVEVSEGFRRVAVNLQYEHRQIRTSIQGIPADATLTRLRDTKLRKIAIPPEGMIVTDYLANELGVRVGQNLSVEVLEGARPTLTLPLVGTVREYIGVSAYMQLDSLNRVLGEDAVISGAVLQVSAAQQADLIQDLKSMPRIAGIVENQAAIDAFYDTLGESMLTFTFITSLLGGIIVFGVVYNNMRIALSERSRELASLRVLGFDRSEVAAILFGELAFLILLAIPLGLFLGYLLCVYLAHAFNTELYRIPLVVDVNTCAFAAFVVLMAALLSGALIWRQLSQLDMVAVLKSKE